MLFTSYYKDAEIPKFKPTEDHVIVESTYRKSTTSMYLEDSRENLVEVKTYSTYKLSQYRNKHNNRIVHEISRELVNANEKVEKKYPLREVTVEELAELRKKERGFVLKENGKYLYTEISFNTKFYCNTLIGEHLCSSCHNCAALPTRCGGCDKVLNYSKNIENYDWIKTGFETFGTETEFMVITSCEHYITMQNPTGREYYMTANRIALEEKRAATKAKHEENQALIAKLKEERKAANS